MNVYLETERMLLREFTWDDVDNLVDLDSNPAVTKFINGGKPTPRDFVVEKVIPRLLSYYQELDQQGVWAALEKSSGEFLGWFHLRPNWSKPIETELGYRFKQMYWGRDFATEGSRALIKKGFEELKVDTIVAMADPENGASRRVMEKAGLRYLEEYRETDDFLVVKYGISSEQYFAGQST